MQENRSFAFLSFVVNLVVGVGLAYTQYQVGANLRVGVIGVAAFILR